jgi:hypothetical protein
VHDLWATHTESEGDLGGSYEIVAVHESAHRATLRPSAEPIAYLLPHSYRGA